MIARIAYGAYLLCIASLIVAMIADAIPA